MVMLRGVFLTSEKPEQTARFYEEIAQLAIERIGQAPDYVYWKVDRDGMQLAIHDSEAFASYTHPALAASNATHLYFTIDDHAGFLAHLDRAGVVPFSVDDVTIIVEDPDGRMVLFGTA